MNGTSWTTGGGGGYSNVLDSLFSPSLLSSQNPRDRSFISFSDWLDRFPNASEIRRRMSTDPIVRADMMNAYIRNNPRSANVTASAASRARMSEESPYERTMRLARDYESYKSKASLIPNNPFIMSPEEFAREDARRVADRIQRARQVTTINYQPNDKPEFKGAKAGQEKVKVPVGPRGELQLDKAGQPATRFRTLPQSEVDRLKLEEARGREDIALQKMQPRVAELEARMGRAEKVEGQLGEEARKQSELAEFSRLLSENPIMSRPEYASKIKDGQALINAGSSAKDAMLYVEGRGGMLDVEQKKSIELIELRGKIAERAKAFGFTLDQAAAQIANTEKERVRQLAAEASSARDSASRERYRASFELQKRNTLLKIIDDIGARERLIASYRNQGKDEEIGLLEGDLEKLKQYRTEIEDLQINELPESGDVGYELSPPVGQQPYVTPTPSPSGGMYSIRLSNGRVIENIREQDLQEALRKFSQAGLSPSAQRM